jgi:long-subunit fatty acid transport protein
MVSYDPCEAQEIEIPASPNPVGSGARAIGMGGAFIAIADDATAASWNPGGLVQLERPEISAVIAGFDRTEDNTFKTNPEASGKQQVSGADLNYLSAVYPFALWQKNVIISISYQNLYDFTRNWNFPFYSTADEAVLTEEFEFDQTGTLSAIGISSAIQITPKVSFGLTVNIWNDDLSPNKWEQKKSRNATLEFLGETIHVNNKIKNTYAFEGVNFNLGILWNLTKKIAIGAVFKTPFTADIKESTSITESFNYPENPELNVTSANTDRADGKLDMPMSYGIGLAYRHSDNLSASFDVYRTQWDDFIYTDANGNKKSLLTDDDSKVTPTCQVRAGIEYLIIKATYVIPIRSGFFYDPAPAKDQPEDFYGFSLGSGLVFKRIALDAAFQYRFGSDVGKSTLQNYGFSQDVSEQMLYISTIFYF